MSKNKVALEEQLILLVQGQAPLFDISSPLFKNDNYKKQKWVEIAETLGVKDTDAVSAAVHCKTLWGTLRNQYLAYLRKTKFPTGTGKKTIPYFRHAESMRFLSDFVEPRKTISNYEPSDSGREEDWNSDDLQDSPSVSSQGSDSQGFELEYELRHVYTVEEDEMEQEQGTDKKQEQKQTVVLPVKSPPIQPSGTRRKRHAQTPFEDALTTTLTSINNFSGPAEDEFDYFCKSLAPSLRRISSKQPRLATQLKIDIQKLFLDAEMD